jgi:radical SAM protein with 4Fe4S-binding SPASM domain
VKHHTMRDDTVTLSAPFRITWDITTRCNLLCRHCYNVSNPQAESISSSHKLLIAEKLSESEVFFVSLSGGEPLMEPEIWNIIKIFKDKGRLIQLISNGTLITERIAQKIKDSGVDSVQISLDGLKESHEYQRGVEGCFEKTVHGITHLSKKDIPVIVNTLISQKNCYEIPALLDFLVDIGVHAFRTSRLIMMGRGETLEGEVLTPEQTRTFIHYILEQRKKYEGKIQVHPDECMSFVGEKISKYGLSWFGCPAGRTECAVDSKGDVYPCVFLIYDEFCMGNLLESDFDDIWHSQKFEAFRTLERKCDCDIADFCKGGCPAAAYGKYGDITRKDPYCWRNTHE